MHELSFIYMIYDYVSIHTALHYRRHWWINRSIIPITSYYTIHTSFHTSVCPCSKFQANLPAIAALKLDLLSLKCCWLANSAIAAIVRSATEVEWVQSGRCAAGWATLGLQWKTRLLVRVREQEGGRKQCRLEAWHLIIGSAWEFLLDMYWIREKVL